MGRRAAAGQHESVLAELVLLMAGLESTISVIGWHVDGRAQGEEPPPRRSLWPRRVPVPAPLPSLPLWCCARARSVWPLTIDDS